MSWRANPPALPSGRPFISPVTPHSADIPQSMWRGTLQIIARGSGTCTLNNQNVAWLISREAIGKSYRRHLKTSYFFVIPI
jgi:hypothetical protein